MVLVPAKCQRVCFWQGSQDYNPIAILVYWLEICRHVENSCAISTISESSTGGSSKCFPKPFQWSQERTVLSKNLWRWSLKISDATATTTTIQRGFFRHELTGNTSHIPQKSPEIRWHLTKVQLFGWSTIYPTRILNKLEKSISYVFQSIHKHGLLARRPKKLFMMLTSKLSLLLDPSGNSTSLRKK